MNNPVVSSWLLSNVMHPFFIYFFICLENNHPPLYRDFNAEGIAVFFLLTMISLMLSLPALGGGVFLSRWLRKLSMGWVEKWLLWLFCIPLLVFANFFLLGLFVMQSFSFDDFREAVMMTTPAISAAITASLILYRAFRRYFTPVDDTHQLLPEKVI